MSKNDIPALFLSDFLQDTHKNIKISKKLQFSEQILIPICY